MLPIYIPTLARHEQQRTFHNLNHTAQQNAVLVVDWHERHLYNNYPVAVMPKHIKPGIGPKRDWIMYKYHNTNKLGESLVMMDDDLKFDTRRTDDPTKFITSTKADVARMMAELKRRLRGSRSGCHVHVGVLSREGGNRITERSILNTRIQRILGYHVPTLRQHNIRFNRTPVMEDFDVTLQLLRLGYGNLVLCDWVQGQASSNAAGGCSTYRTLAVQEQGAKRLKRLHPEFVTVVRKQTKTAWGGAERTDVRIQWKRAYESAKR